MKHLLFDGSNNDWHFLWKHQSSYKQQRINITNNPNKNGCLIYYKSQHNEKSSTARGREREREVH